MTGYLIIKYLHILAAIVMVGTTFCNGMLRFYANNSNSLPVIATISNAVMHLNRRLMMPSLLLLFVTGFTLTRLAAISVFTSWLLAGLVLAILVLLAFIVGYRVEQRMAVAAQESLVEQRSEIKASYWQLDRLGIWIGSGATLLSLVILYLMIGKPLW